MAKTPDEGPIISRQDSLSSRNFSDLGKSLTSRNFQDLFRPVAAPIPVAPPAPVGQQDGGNAPAPQPPAAPSKE
jgi:hypothetical protein